MTSRRSGPSCRPSRRIPPRSRPPGAHGKPRPKPPCDTPSTSLLPGRSSHNHFPPHPPHPARLARKIPRGHVPPAKGISQHAGCARRASVLVASVFMVLTVVDIDHGNRQDNTAPIQWRHRRSIVQYRLARLVHPTNRYFTGCCFL